MNPVKRKQRGQLNIVIILSMISLTPSILFAAAPKPNVILIMADDLGYECIGANGCDDYKTPVLDQLASTGVRFVNCFSNPLCTPSRVKIMTGRYNVRNYVEFGRLDRKEKTFAHAFKEAGYETCIAGKWQLGREYDSPQHFGFDQSCLWQQSRPRKRAGTPIDSRFNNPLLDINGVEKEYSAGEYGPDVCVDFICDFIDQNKEKPFLAYYPMLLTHCPFCPTPDSANWDPASLGVNHYKGDAKYIGDMVEYMDKMVGRIIAKVEEHNLRENTLIIFTGDNGTDVPVVTSLDGKKVPGGKGKMNDNGTRVPLIVSYPKTIQSGVVSEELVEFSDFYPTLCDAGGLTPQNDAGQDGVSFWNTLQGKPGREKPWIYIWYQGNILARTQTHMVRRIKKTGEVEFVDCSTPYEEKVLAVENLSGVDAEPYNSLVEVLLNFDKARPIP